MQRRAPGVFSKQGGTHRDKPFPTPMFRFLPSSNLRARTQDPETSMIILLFEVPRAKIRAREAIGVSASIGLAVGGAAAAAAGAAVAAAQGFAQGAR